MSDVQSNKLIVLGSGFSAALFSEMPTLVKLSKKIVSTIEQDTYSLNQPLKERLSQIPETIKRNIEMLLSFLISDMPWKIPATKYLDQALYSHISMKLAQTLRADFNLENPKTNVQKLFKIIEDQKIPVITFNYDSIFEDLFCTLAKPKVYQPFDLYQIPMHYELQRYPGAVLGSKTKSAPHLVKLHGSINWYFSGNFEYKTEQLYYSKSDVPDLCPFIIPPTLDKNTFYKHNSLQHLWYKASSYIKHATDIYFIGYSFPESDLPVRFFFQDNLNAVTDEGKSLIPKRKLHLVNKCADEDACNKLIARYEHYLCSTTEVSIKMKTTYCGYASDTNYLEKFIDNLE